MRQELPEVAVAHPGDDPGQFIEKLEAGHWFDLPHYTSEDLGRAIAYGARAAALWWSCPRRPTLAASWVGWR